MDLVILGSTARQGLSRLLLSSVAEDVVSRATVPLLLVRPAGRAEGEPAVRSFDDDAVRAGPVAPRILGLRTVELARIVGISLAVTTVNPAFVSFSETTCRMCDSSSATRIRFGVAIVCSSSCTFTG